MTEPNLDQFIDYWTPLLVRLCIDVGVFEAFGAAERGGDEVARDLRLHPDALRRVLRALAASGLFVEVRPQAYRLTRIGSRFLSDHPASIAGLGSFKPWELHAWAEARHSLRTGEPAFPAYFGKPYFDWLGDQPTAANQFHHDMRRRTAALLREGIAAYDWPSRGEVVDIGGGAGEFLAALLLRETGLRGTLFDVEHGLVGAAEYLADAGVVERVRITPGDFFEAVPAGADLLVLSSVLHDWDDVDAGRILSNCRAAMGPAARLLIFDYVIPEDPGYDLGKLLDLHMLVQFGGRERSGAEWADLLAAAGLGIDRVISTAGLAWIEARPSVEPTG